MDKRKKSKLWLIGLIGFFLYFAYVMIDQQKILYVRDMEMADIQNKIKEEEKTGQELQKHKDTLDSDEYIEKVAREKLGMVKQEEKIFVDVNK